MAEIIVAYSGVHQAYQLALAAQEVGQLRNFYCSFFDAPGKLGRALRLFLGAEALRNRRIDGIPAIKVVEHPWPELSFKLRQRMVGSPGNAWISAAHTFDRWVARKLSEASGGVFVGVENCAFYSFQAAKVRGMKLVYDCPGYNARHTQAAAEETAKRFGLSAVSVGDTPEIERRKAVEIELADHVLCCSQVHAESLRGFGVSKEKAVVVPLWIDPRQWRPKQSGGQHAGKLRVLYAGGISLRKGIPYLVDATRKLDGAVELTLVGTINDDIRPVLSGGEGQIKVLAPVSKGALCAIYQDHDVLVLPSLGDSFGFVALEAMACGLPVVVTTNCGVPVPDSAWRVPVMDSVAIMRRLELYADDRDLLAMDGLRARAFAAQFTPERYREEIKRFYSLLLTRVEP